MKQKDFDVFLVSEPHVVFNGSKYEFMAIAKVADYRKLRMKQYHPLIIPRDLNLKEGFPRYRAIARAERNSVLGCLVLTEFPWRER